MARSLLVENMLPQFVGSIISAICIMFFPADADLIANFLIEILFSTAYNVIIKTSSNYKYYNIIYYIYNIYV